MLYVASYHKEDESKECGFYQEQSEKFRTFDDAKIWLKKQADNASRSFRSGHVEGWLTDGELEEGDYNHRVYLPEGRYGALKSFLEA